jgi:uncharacterized Zn-finger protein
VFKFVSDLRQVSGFQQGTPVSVTNNTDRINKKIVLEICIFFAGERPFCCDICSKSFNQKNALQIHMKKHSGEKPHKCIYCELAFTQKGNLKTHIKRAHQISRTIFLLIPQ